MFKILAFADVRSETKVSKFSCAKEMREKSRTSHLAGLWFEAVLYDQTRKAGVSEKGGVSILINKVEKYSENLKRKILSELSRKLDMAEENYDSEKFQEFLDKQQYRTADIFYYDSIA